MPLIITPGQLSRRAEFYYQLAQLTSAGLTLINALEHLKQNPPTFSYRVHIRNLLNDLKEGYTFSQALNREKGWLPAFDVALLHAGEHSGRLDQCFRLLSDHYQDRARLARQMIGDLAYPLFVKPIAEGSGKGVNARSRVSDAAGLRELAYELLARFRQPVLVETYLPGREFTVGITGTGVDARVLGVLEIAPTGKAAGSDYGFENKERCDENVVYRLVEDAQSEAAAAIALKAWRVLRCRDGGRIDIRSDSAGRPQFVEVNPLAGLNPEHSDLCFLAGFRGLSYQDLIGLILESFLQRHPELAARKAAA